MSQKKFFSLALILVFLMSGFFYFKLQSAQAKWCEAFFSFECDAYAQLECLGADYVYEKAGSFCRNSTCVSVYDIYCQVNEVQWSFKTDVECESLNHPDCDNW